MEIEKLYQLFLEHPIVTTDSRDCPPQSIFFALKGTLFNGNQFAALSLEKGCAYAVIDEEQWHNPADHRYILVDDCLKTLKLLANFHRKTLNIPVIGITGTNGKTTTKELISSVLSTQFNVLYTLGNFNNDIGVPKTLLRLTAQHQIAVIEMGASHIGDIKALVDVVEPDFALITNVGRAHLQGFGSLEGVMKTKAELFSYMQAHKQQSGKVFINQDNEHLLQMKQAHCPDLSTIAYSQNHAPNAQVLGKVTGNTPYLSFSWQQISSQVWHEVKTHLIGTYNLDNMLAAISIGLFFGITPKHISQALANYIPNNNRSQLETTSTNHLIVDAYNANPTSMMAALHNFQQMEIEHKMVILGDMLELGKASLTEHQKICDYLSTLAFDKVWLVGNEFCQCTTPFKCFTDVEAVKQHISQHPPTHYYILIKGSNGIKLSQLPTLL